MRSYVNTPDLRAKSLFPDEALPYIDVTSDIDMERFKALKEGKKELISALKLSIIRGGV